ELVARSPNDGVIRSGLGATLHNLALLHHDRREWEASARLLRQAIDHQQVAARAAPRRFSPRHFLYRHHALLGSVGLRAGQPDEPGKVFAVALRLASELAGEFPDQVEATEALGEGHANLGEWLQHARRDGEAREHVRRGLEIRQRLAKEFP